MCHSEAQPKNLGLSFGVKILRVAQDDRRTTIFHGRVDAVIILFRYWQGGQAWLI